MSNGVKQSKALKLPAAPLVQLGEGQHELWTGEYYNEGIGGQGGLFDKLNEECGVFGVYGHPEASSLCYYGLHALQHRGQESAGICTVDEGKFNYYRGMGLAKEVFTNDNLHPLTGSTADCSCALFNSRRKQAGECAAARVQIP